MTALEEKFRALGEWKHLSEEEKQEVKEQDGTLEGREDERSPRVIDKIDIFAGVAMVSILGTQYWIHRDLLIVIDLVLFAFASYYAGRKHSTRKMIGELKDSELVPIDWVEEALSEVFPNHEVEVSYGGENYDT